MSLNRQASSWSLRARLLAGQVLLVGGVCLGVGVVTEGALYQYLMSQLDDQLQETAHRSAMFFRAPPPPPGSWRQGRPPYPRSGPGPGFLEAPGQPIGMVALVVRAQEPVSAGVLSAGGERSAVSPAAEQQLTEAAGTRRPITRSLDGLGRYRLTSAFGGPASNNLVVGLPLSAVTETLLRVALIFAVVTIAALALAVIVGSALIRHALTPLNRVAAAAAEVASLPLDRGEVELPIRVTAADANPRTEIGRLGVTLNRMLDHIAAALSARQASESRVRQFVADASHELRTPLAAIRGYTELAQRNRAEVPDDVAHAMGRVESEAQRMTHLVEDLLLLARLDSGRPLQSDPVDLSRLCADAIGDAHVAGPGHVWQLDLPDEPVCVVGDEPRLHQVVANLLANARIHTPPGTVVTVALDTEERFAVLRVSDDGPGIPAALQSEVFERFARGDTSRSRKGGSTGLGLAIVAAVVRAHYGTIAVRSEPGSTEFTVRLPRDNSGTTFDSLR